MKKTTLYAGAALMALAVSSPLATAQDGIPEGLNDQVRALQAEGWNVTEVEKTYWGRWIIEAGKDGQEREIVMSGDGERVIRSHTDNESNDDSGSSSSDNESNDDESNSGGSSSSDNESNDDETDDSGSNESDDNENDDNESDDDESDD